MRMRGFISQGLAGNPILAVTTVEITTHHPEGERITPRINMVEGLFLHRIALHPGDITERNSQLATLIETHFADPAFGLSD